MSPEDTALCQQGIDLYNADQKLEAYPIFCKLYDNGNTEDMTLLFWLAYTTPRLDEAQRAMETIARLEPNHPKLPELRKRVSKKQQRLMMRAFPPDKYGPVMTCPYCHRSGPARYAKKISVAGWVWFAAFFVLFLACLFTPIEYIQTYTSLVPADPSQAQSLFGEAVFFLLLSIIGLFIKKHFYTCGHCSIRLGDMH